MISLTERATEKNSKRVDARMVDSPCIGVCRLKNGVCIGCYRTIEEVKSWHKITEEQKQAILDRLKLYQQS